MFVLWLGVRVTIRVRGLETQAFRVRNVWKPIKQCTNKEYDTHGFDLRLFFLCCLQRE